MSTRWEIMSRFVHPNRSLRGAVLIAVCLAGLFVGHPASASDSPPSTFAAGLNKAGPDGVTPRSEALASGLGGAAVQGSPTYDYADVGSDHFAALDIAALAADGVLAGTDCRPGHFCPEMPIERWQAAVWIVRVLDGEEPSPRASRFGDVEGGLWWESHVERLAELGVTVGCSLQPARFCPTGTVTRAQMAAFLDRAFDLPAAPDAGFTDTAGVFSRDAINRLFGSGITLGCTPSAFCPDRSVTRAQMAAFLQRGRPEPGVGIPTGHDVGPDDAFYASPLLGISNVVVAVHYCGPPGAFTESQLVAETAKLNQVAIFFERESGGESIVTFELGGLHSPPEATSSERWARESISKWHGAGRGENPCYRTVLGGSGRGGSSSLDRRDVALILADVDIGKKADGSRVAGFGPPGGPLFGNTPPYVVVQPSTRYSSSYIYWLVAHEIGHAAYSLCHPFSSYPGCAVQKADTDVATECTRRNGAPDCGGDERLTELAGSVMSYWSYGSYGKLSDSYVACEQKRWLGWHDNPCGAPDAPAAPSPQAANDQVIVTWATPRDDGWSPITRYHLSYKPSAQKDWKSQTHAASVTQATITGLDNGAEYEFRVRAENTQGTGDWSPTATATLEAAVRAPEAPATPQLTPGDEQVTVEWAAPNDNGTPIIGYIVAYRPKGHTNWQTRTFTPSPTQGIIKGLTNDTEYEIRVRALNSLSPQGRSNWSPTATATPGAAAQPPEAPATPRVTPGDGQVTVEWAAPDDNGSPITGYQLTYRQSGDANWRSRTLTPSPTQLTITGLDNDTRHEFRVLAQNSEGRSDWSPTATATPGADEQVPDAPGAPRLTAGDGQITVEWDAPDNNGSRITDYNVSYSVSGADDWTTLWGDPDTRSLTITGLENDTQYSVRVDAHNADGPSDWSPIATATPVADEQPPDAPSAPRLTAGYAQVTVEWDRPDDNGSPITAYEVDLYRDGVLEDGIWTSTSPSDRTASWIPTDLDNGVEYGFRVRAENSEGFGGWSPIATAVPTAAAPRPNAPGKPRLTAGDGQITVEWDAPDDNGEPITAYEVSWRLNNRWWPLSGHGSWTRSDVVTGLDNGVEYGYRVRAVGSQGRSDWSPAAFATPTADAQWPDAPSAPRLTAGDGQIFVEWDAPDDNGSPITSYVVGYGVSYVDEETLNVDDPGTRSTTITGLTNGTQYSVVVFATNAGGDSDWSEAAYATPVADAQPPDAPGAPQLTAGNEQITVEWDAPDDNGSPITSYWVAYAVSGTQDWTYLESGSSTRSTTITGLENDTEYWVLVQAVNVVGSSDWSEEAYATPVADAQPPDAPSAPQLTAGNEQITVEWDAPDDNGSPITGYEVGYLMGGDDPSYIDVDDPSTRSLTITGLENDTQYFVAVQAENAVGDSDWSDISFATPTAQPPDAPSALRLRPSDEQIVVDWEAPDDNGSPITRYPVRYRKVGAGSWRRAQTSSTRITLTDLDNGTEYEIYVEAENSEGLSDQSSIEKATPYAGGPGPDAPGMPRVTPGDGQVTLEWDEPDDNGVAITHYLVKWNKVGDSSFTTTWATSTQATVTYNLENGVAYEFSVRAKDSEGFFGGWSPVATATPS